MADNKYWWAESDSEDTHKKIFAHLKELLTNQTYNQVENFKYLRLYGNYDLSSLRGYNYVKSEPSTALQNRITLNIVQSMIDTVESKITKNKPKPMFLTENGDWSLQQKAKKLNQFIEGQFNISDYYQKAAQAFKDSCIFGTGILKIYRKNSEIAVDRVFPDEIIIDDREALYGEPREIHQKKYYHKEVLKAMFPKFKFQIDTVNQAQTYYTSESGQSSSDMVMVTESWHLPSGEKSGDGKRAICIENATLLEEEYTKKYFPFVFLRWNTRPIGFLGQGIAEQLSGIQLEINKILRTIQVAMHLVSIPKLFVDVNSKVVTSHLDNKIGGIIKFAGQKPTYDQLGAVPPELFKQLDFLYNKAYEIIGISQLSATSMKPAGLNSGKALRTYNDLESERFMAVAQRYEQSFLSAAKQMIDIVKEIYEDDGSFKVKVKGKKFLKTIDWKEVNIDDDSYLMTLFPTSSLSSTPAGRLQDVQELLEAGFIDKEYALKLLDFPDLEGFYSYKTAALENILKIIDKMIEDNEYSTPEPYQNLDYGIKLMQEAYLYYQNEGAPEDNLELMRRWIEDANALLTKAQQVTAPAQDVMQEEAPSTAPVEEQLPEQPQQSVQE